LVRESAVVIRRDQQVLLAQRPATATRWASLWEFPHGPLGEGETHDAAAVRLAHELTGLEVRLGPELVTIKHGITRYQITLVCFEAFAVGGECTSPFYSASAWLSPADLAAYPVSSPQRRLARLVAAPDRQRRLF
jgi:A/G-specific adenine glycosylase